MKGEGRARRGLGVSQTIYCYFSQKEQEKAVKWRKGMIRIQSNEKELSNLTERKLSCKTKTEDCIVFYKGSW